MTQTIEINEARLEAFGDQVFGDLAASYGGVMRCWATSWGCTRP